MTTSLLIGLWHITALPAIFESIFSAVRSAGRSRRRLMGCYHQPGAHQWLSARMFSNEAGMGSTPNAAAARFTASASGCAGIVQMIGVLIDTIVICTPARVIIMLAPLDEAEDAVNGIKSIQHAMTSLVGGWGGGRFVAIVVLLFCLQFYRRKLHLC